jgi:hypothetical protein
MSDDETNVSGIMLHTRCVCATPPPYAHLSIWQRLLHRLLIELIESPNERREHTLAMAARRDLEQTIR